MINFNNHNITGMSYNNHTIKKAYGCDGRLVWSGGTPVAPYKYIAKYSDGHITSAACDSSSAITQGEVSGSSSLVSIDISDCVCEISSCAFCNCTRLSGVTLPSYVCSLGDSAFANTRLSGVTLPDRLSVSSVGSGVFRDNPELEYVIVPENCNLGNYEFYNCKKLSSVTLKTGIHNSKSLPVGVFEGCTNLKHIEVPSTFSTISREAFSGCTSLSSITLSNSINGLGVRTFKDCTALKTITIPENTTSVSASTFENCTSLSSVTFSSNLKMIGESAFKNCQNLSSITISNKVTSIGKTSFANCSRLTSVSLPSSVSSIGSYAFSGCTSLSSITINRTTPPSLEEGALSGTTSNIFVPCSALYTYKAQWVDYEKRLRGISPCPEPKWASTYISGGTRYIATGSCGSSTTIAKGEVHYGFKVEIGSCVKTIGQQAFENFTGLETLVIGSGVTTIQAYAFVNDNSIYEIYCHPKTPPSLGNMVFTVTPSNVTVYVPYSSKNTYKSTAGWMDFNIQSL